MLHHSISLPAAKRPFASASLSRGVRALREAGFTLVELLATVLIMAVLALLMFPMGGKARESSQSLRCVQNMRQSGLAILAFMREGSPRFETFAGGANTKVRIWGDLLHNERYLANRESVRCPSATSSHPIENGNWYWSSFGFYMPASEEAFTSHQQPAAQGFVLNLTRIVEPGSRVLLADSMNPTTGHQTFRIKAESPVSSAFALRHKGRSNAFFLDGHVRSLDREDLVDLGVAETFIRAPVVN